MEVGNAQSVDRNFVFLANFNFDISDLLGGCFILSSWFHRELLGPLLDMQYHVGGDPRLP